MVEYRLSDRADSQIEMIFQDSVKLFGLYQAEAYHSGLRHTFELLAAFPLMGTAAEHLAPRLRRLRSNIFRTAEPDYVFVRQLLHVRMDLRPDLFE